MFIAKNHNLQKQGCNAILGFLVTSQSSRALLIWFVNVNRNPLMLLSSQLPLIDSVLFQQWKNNTFIFTAKVSHTVIEMYMSLLNLISVHFYRASNT